MSQSKIQVFTEEANPILASYLNTLLGQEIKFNLGEASETTIEQLKTEATTSFSIVCTPENAEPFIIQLEPSWIPVISNAMVGREMTPEEEGVFDLTGQIISQSYDAVTKEHALASLFPAMEATPFAPGTWTPEATLPADFWLIPFNMEIGDQVLKGNAGVPAIMVEKLEIPAKPAPEAEQPEQSPVDESVGVSEPSFPDFGRENLQQEGPGNFDLLAEVELNVTVELGRRKIPLSEVLKLTTGSVIELEKLVGEPLEIFANGRLIAEGEAVVIEEQFGIRITNLASNKLRAKAFA